VKTLENCEVVAVASRDSDRAAAFAGRCGIPRAYGNYAELLDDPEVDAVYNPLPVSMHAEWSIRCAEAGKPVLCEKPMACNSADAQRMVDAFAERGLPLAEALMCRFHPRIAKLGEMLAEDAIGETRVIHSVFCAQVPAGKFQHSKAMGGGALLDVGSYCVSLARFVAGEEPVNVGATAHLTDDGTDDYMVCTLEFPSGILGSFACSINTEFDCNYHIFGSEGRIFARKGVVPNPDEPAELQLWQEYQMEEIAIAPADQWQLCISDFADALLNDRPPGIPAEESVRNLKVIDRLFEAARAG
jgi:predicted dehydrogenase